MARVNDGILGRFSTSASNSLCVLVLDVTIMGLVWRSVPPTAKREG